MKDDFLIIACCFVTIFVLLFVIINPIFLAPCYNKFEKIEKNKLKDKIEELAKKLNFPLAHIEIIDGSKRSDHSNAYFYGFGENKRAVLFDTLLK